MFERQKQSMEHAMSLQGGNAMSEIKSTFGYVNNEGNRSFYIFHECSGCLNPVISRISLKPSIHFRALTTSLQERFVLEVQNYIKNPSEVAFPKKLSEDQGAIVIEGIVDGLSSKCPCCGHKELWQDEETAPMSGKNVNIMMLTDLESAYMVAINLLKERVGTQYADLVKHAELIEDDHSISLRLVKEGDSVENKNIVPLKALPKICDAHESTFINEIREKQSLLKAIEFVNRF